MKPRWRALAALGIFLVVVFPASAADDRALVGFTSGTGSGGHTCVFLLKRL